MYNLSRKRKTLIFLSVCLLGIATIPATAVTMPAPLYPLIAVFVLGVMAPLALGLFVYKNRIAKIYLIVATATVILGLTIAIFDTIRNKQFADTCASRGSGNKALFIDTGAICVAPTDENTYYDSDTGTLASTTLPVFALNSLMGFGGLLYAPFYWGLQQRKLRHIST